MTKKAKSKQIWHEERHSMLKFHLERTRVVRRKKSDWKGVKESDKNSHSHSLMKFQSESSRLKGRRSRWKFHLERTRMWGRKKSHSHSLMR